MATSLKELIVTYEANAKPVLNALNQIDAKLKSTTRSLRSTGESFTRLGQSLSLGLSLPILTLTGLSIKAASDAEEIFNKFNVVFKNVSNEADKIGKDLAKSFGLSQVKSRELLADTGDLLTGFGFTGKAALDLANKTNRLAVDLASFTNFSGGAEGASKALTKALLGERESVKSLGIAILEEDVKKEISILRSKGARFETERQAKAIATLNIAYRQSKNAIGDYSRTSEEFANRFRLLKNRIFDVRVGLGRLVLPKVTEFLGKFNNFLEKFAEGLSRLDDRAKKIIVFLGLLFGLIGPGLIILGSLFRLLGFAAGGFSFLLKPIRSLVGLLPRIIGGFGLLKGVLVANPLLAFLGASYLLITYWEEIIGLFEKAFTWLSKISLSDVWGKFKDFVGIGDGQIDISSGAKASMTNTTNKSSIANNQKTVNNNLTVNIPPGVSGSDATGIKDAIRQALQEENRQSYIELGVQ